MLQLTGEDDLQDVRSAVADLAGRWKDLGLSLGINVNDLDAIPFSSPSECLREMLAMWLRQSYNVRTTLACTLSSLLLYYTKCTSLASKRSILSYSLATLVTTCKVLEFIRSRIWVC